MKTYAYIRVSSRDQNETRQLMAMRERQVEKSKTYIDRQSGKDFDRPAYTRMVNRLKAGDLLYIMSIDRLGRNYDEILVQWRLLTKQIGVDICVIDMPLLDTRRDKDLIGSFIADIVLQILSFVSQNERENIRERQRQGIEAARKLGVHLGRPSKPLDRRFDDSVLAWKEGKLTATQAANNCGMSLSTFYRKRKQLNCLRR